MMDEDKQIRLLSEVQSLIANVERDVQTNTRVSLAQILVEMQTDMKNETAIDFKRYSYALYRIVSDDIDLERSEIGKELLRFSIQLQKK